MDVRAVLAVFFLSMAAVIAAEGNIEFWRDTVTMTCPGEGEWYENGKNFLNSTSHEFKYDGKSNVVYCKHGDSYYYFYAKGKACTNCFELDPTLFLFIITVDVIGTAILMIIIYKCTKKKGSTGPAQPKTSSRSGPAPPTPSRDYEQLNIHTRSQDTYSIVNRTG